MLKVLSVHVECKDLKETRDLKETKDLKEKLVLQDRPPEQMFK